MAEIKSVPYVPWSHPFVERLLGTIRRECQSHRLRDETKFTTVDVCWGGYSLRKKVGQVLKAHRLRVLLADDHKAILQRVKGVLNGEFEVVGAVENGQALVDLARELDPDVLIVDIEMPVINGIEAVRQIKKSGSKAKVVFLTVHEDPDMVSLCLEVGALGFVVKSRLASDLVPAIRLALTNHTFVSPTLPWARS